MTEQRGKKLSFESREQDAVPGPVIPQAAGRHSRPSSQRRHAERVGNVLSPVARQLKGILQVNLPKGWGITTDRTGKERPMSEKQPDFSALYSEYYPKIAGYLRKLVGDLEAEDLTQETFVKINRSLGGFRGESSLSTWIYRIATNTALDHLKGPAGQAKRKTLGFAPDDGPSDAGDIALMDDVPPVDALLIRKDMNECIRGLVNDLPGNYRTVLMLSDLEGFSNAEIADLLGLSLDTVKIRLHRARLQLRKSMDQACYLYRDGRNELSCDRKPATLEFKKK